MLKAAICDDSAKTIARLEQILDDIPTIVGEYDVFVSGRDVLHCRKSMTIKYDIYILDIEMPQIDGITLANEIRKYDRTALIVFLTSHPEYVYDVFNVVVFDFIVKPVTSKKVKRLFERAISYLDLTNKMFHFSFDKNQYTLECKEILYFEKEKRKIHIYTEKEQFETYLSRKEVVGQLDASVFVSISYSYVVNLGFIKEIRKNEAILKNKAHLPISRKNKQSVKEKHLEFLLKRY